MRCRPPRWRSCRTRTAKLVGIRLRLDKKEGEGDELGYLRYPAVVEELYLTAKPKGVLGMAPLAAPKTRNWGREGNENPVRRQQGVNGRRGNADPLVPGLLGAERETLGLVAWRRR